MEIKKLAQEVFEIEAKEIANIFHLDVTSATKGCKNALAIINNLEKDMVNGDKTNLGKTKPEDFQSAEESL